MFSFDRWEEVVGESRGGLGGKYGFGGGRIIDEGMRKISGVVEEIIEDFGGEVGFEGKEGDE